MRAVIGLAYAGGDMASNALDSKAKICDAALALLRQDIGYSGSPSIAAKCDSVWNLAYDTLASAHVWSEGVSVGDTVPRSSMLRNVLVYALAKELAIPVTGRQEDRKNVSDVYEEKLSVAISKDLEDEMVSLRAKTDADSRLAAEVLDILRQYYSVADGEHKNGIKKPQPRGIAQLVQHINNIKETVRKEVLMSHDWSFATNEAKSTSYRMDDGRYRTCFPGDAIKIIKCYSDVCEKAETFAREGDFLYSYAPLERIVYLCDVEDVEEWTLLAKRAFIYKLVQAVSLANPELVSNANRIAQLNATVKEAVEEARTADARQTHAGTGTYGRNYLYDVATGRRPPKWQHY